MIECMEDSYPCQGSQGSCSSSVCSVMLTCSIALMINEAFGSEETSTVSVHVILERELDKLKQKTEGLNKL